MSVITTPGSLSRRIFSENSVRRRIASTSDARRNSSGMIAVTKFDSPRGIAQISSMTASDAAALGVDDLQVGLDVRQLPEPRADPGVAVRAGDVDRAEFVACDPRAYQTASRSAASSDST